MKIVTIKSCASRESEYSFINKMLAQAESYNALDLRAKVGAVIVDLDGNVKSKGSNGSEYHITDGCKRVNTKKGTGYDICKGCSVENHAEMKALRDKPDDVKVFDLYLYGYDKPCDHCYNELEKAGCRTVFVI